MTWPQILGHLSNGGEKQRLHIINIVWIIFIKKLTEITTNEQNDDGDDDDRICSLEEKPVTNFHWIIAYVLIKKQV